MACVPKRITWSNNLDDAGSGYVMIYGNCQPKPYTKPLAYKLTRIKTDVAKKIGYTTFGGMANANADKGDYLIGPNFLDQVFISSRVIQFTNKLADKLFNQLDEQAMLAVNFVERKQAASMLVSRLMQIARFAKALRKFDLPTAALSLGIDPNSGIPKIYAKGKKPKGWSSAKQRSKIVADAWLEFHFGWEPLVKDIFHATEVLSNPMTGKKVEVKTGLNINDTYKRTVGSEVYTRTCQGLIGGKAGATLYVTDVNAYLNNRLGLTNPAAWAWELIPFSFVVDWFTTVGAFINQWTDLEGVKVVDPWYNMHLSCSCVYTQTYPGKSMYIASHGTIYRRYTSLPRYKIAFRPLKRLSLVRAATAIALLTQFLPR